ncbi:outer membrane beta-barrel domain-containing protein [Exilibacterium tricleocarpae]|uniref:Outer membrane beta-barrel domain-containing protein n=1 Tax=Exilibacterium tricleocarpae TaxID=2591008 RepID=A0A545TZ02_9GAMM|nr:outer membrane beta-barrel domain-containing protein [Exilibacterium tricleocarpae]TQV82448.1 outer membrane beta-barrel domain-containing protein [Exilibacterium tricleocarpae]
MESRNQRIFLIAAALAALLPLAPAQAQEDENAERSVLDRIITPDMERREIEEDQIDSEDFEIGVYFGVMSVEDFGSNEVTGVRFAYHVTEDFFLEAAYGETTTSETSFETLTGSVQLLTPEQREFSYYNLSVGYNFLPGEVFIGENWAFNSTFYLIAGAGNTDFAGEENFTYNLGMGLRFFATDWLALHFDVRDHIMDLDIFGEEKTTNNIEATIGLTFFF